MAYCISFYNNNNNNNQPSQRWRILDCSGTRKKCSTIHVRKGVQVQDSLGIKMDESTVITSLKEGTQYKFLGVLENLKQDDKLALKVAAKVF